MAELSLTEASQAIGVSVDTLRRWDRAGPVANFLMLNPSTADEVKLDPTCSRARGYAERWGYGALVVTNVFAWRATDPAQLKAARDPVGPANDRAILRAAREAAHDTMDEVRRVMHLRAEL